MPCKFFFFYFIYTFHFRLVFERTADKRVRVQTAGSRITAGIRVLARGNGGKRCRVSGFDGIEEQNIKRKERYCEAFVLHERHVD